MPTRREIGNYWQDFNRQFEWGKSPVWQHIAQFTPGPALGNFYTGVQQGNVPGAVISAASAAPTFASLKAVKQVPGVFSPAVADRLRTLLAYAGNQAAGVGSDVMTTK